MEVTCSKLGVARRLSAFLVLSSALATASCGVDNADSIESRHGRKACTDGIDNDHDGKIDYPADPSCSSKTDNDESDPATPPPASLAAPTTPTGFAALAGDGQVELTWSASPAAEQIDTYQVYRNGGDYKLDVPCCSFVDTNVVNGTAYNYRLGAHNATAFGPWTDPALVATPAVTQQPPVTDPPPTLAAPTIPTDFSAMASDGKVTLTWSANPAEQQIDTYQVYRNGGSFKLDVPCCTFVDTNVVNGTAYNYRLGAHNATAFGPWTDPALVATPAAAQPPVTDPPSTDPPPAVTGKHDFPRTFMINSWKDVSELWKYDFVVSFNWMNVAGYHAKNPNGVAVTYVRLDTPAVVPANPSPAGNMWETYWHETSINLTYQETVNPWIADQRSYSAQGWKGGTDTLVDGQAAMVGSIRAFQASDSSGAQTGCALNSVCEGWNVTSSSTADWLKRILVYAAKVDGLYSRGWDGVWSDNVVCANSSGAFCNNLVAIETFLRDSLPGKNVGGNGAWEIRNKPGFPANCCGGWLGSDVDGFKKMANMNLVEGLGYYGSDEDLFISWNREVVNYPDPYGRPRYNALWEYAGGNSPARVRYGLTLAMMADSYYMAVDGQWYDEFWGGALGRRGYLGQPTGAPVKLANGVWRRDFDHGIVLLNGSGSAKTTDLGGTFHKLTGTQDPTVNNGATVTSVSIPDNDGLILLR